MPANIDDRSDARGIQDRTWANLFLRSQIGVRKNADSKSDLERGLTVEEDVHQLTGGDCKLSRLSSSYGSWKKLVILLISNQISVYLEGVFKMRLLISDINIAIGPFARLLVDLCRFCGYQQPQDLLRIMIKIVFKISGINYWDLCCWYFVIKGFSFGNILVPQHRQCNVQFLLWKLQSLYSI